MLVKICGIRTVDQALAAIAAGADLLGLVFAASKRRVTIELGAEIAAAVHAVSAVPLVGLFVNEAPVDIRWTLQRVGLDMIQLSGDEAVTDAFADVPLLKSLRMQDDAAEAEWRAVLTTAARDWRLGRGLPHQTALIDAHVAGAYGGTGAQADWTRAADWARTLPIMLAGGLRPDNVAAAIEQVRPAAVDVSSGVERDGHKDPALMQAFVRAVREAAADG